MYTWCPKLMPIICMPFWWIIKILWNVIRFVFHDSVFARNLLAKFARPGKRKAASSDK